MMCKRAVLFQNGALAHCTYGYKNTKPKGITRMIIETERLILRPWSEDDAESLYEFAKDPRVGPIAGWSVHTSVENSRQVIKEILSADGTFAIVRKGEDKAIGSIGLLIGEKSNLKIRHDEAEIGYWIGVPYWGKGMVPEAIQELIKYAFEKAGIKYGAGILMEMKNQNVVRKNADSNTTILNQIRSGRRCMTSEQSILPV